MGIGLFFGILLIIIGVLVILKGVFRIDFPVFKIAFAIFLVYIGIRIMSTSFSSKKNIKSDVVAFNEKHFDIKTNTNNTFNVVFGKGVINLSQFQWDSTNTSVSIHTVFGGSEIRINNSLPIKIEATTAFGGIRLPKGNGTGGFGTTYYYTSSFRENKPYILIKTTAVFGGSEIIEN